MTEPDDIYREVRMRPHGVRVEHQGPDYEWSSDVEVTARAEGTSVTVGDLAFWVTGAKGGCKLVVTYRGDTGLRRPVSGR